MSFIAKETLFFQRRMESNVSGKKILTHCPHIFRLRSLAYLTLNFCPSYARAAYLYWESTTKERFREFPDNISGTRFLTRRRKARFRPQLYLELFIFVALQSRAHCRRSCEQMPAIFSTCRCSPQSINLLRKNDIIWIAKFLRPLATCCDRLIFRFPRLVARMFVFEGD